MNEEYKNLLLPILRDAIQQDREDVAKYCTLLAIELGAEIAVESEDPDEEDMTEGDGPRDRQVLTSQSHHITYDGERIATLTRESWSTYGSIDHPDTPYGEWTTDASEGDEEPSDAWRAVVAAAGIDDDEWDNIPECDEEEIVPPATDPEGEYCLWWSTVPTSESGPTGDRYATLADARDARQLADHSLRTTHRGDLLCGYGIGQLVDGEWVEVREEEQTV